MVNALFSSRSGGSKNFVFHGTYFGWADILVQLNDIFILLYNFTSFDPSQKLYARECARVDKGQARVVPKLRQAHIIRDSWTKLNVTPAKIMQA